MAESEDTKDVKKTASLMISYSRKDKDFVKQLYDSLIARGFSREDIWVDWKGIPLSADWRAEITKGIQSANAFIFVISPDSVASEVCAEELEIAADSNKRFIPILHREPGKGAKLHPKISSHNWVFIRDEQELEKMLPALVDAINTDLGWLAQHTRLFNRAKEWDTKGRNDSYLVRGNDLQDAESFITEGATGKEPPPTQLHVDYVQASKKFAENVRRRNRSIAGVVGVALVALSIFAMIQRNQALDNRDTANTQEAIAQANATEANQQRATAQANEKIAQENEATANKNAREANALALATEAINQKGNDTQLGLMLALLSIQGTQPDGVVLPESKSALFASLNTPNVLFTWQDDSIISAVAFNQNGNYIAFGDDNGQVQILDAESHNLIQSFQFDDTINGLDFSPDGQRLGVAIWNSVTEVGSAEVVNVETGDELFQLAGHDGYKVNDIDYSPDGKLIATGGGDWYVKIWNADTGSIRVTLPSHTDSVTSVAFSPDSTRLVSGSLDDTVILWDLETNSLLNKFRPDGFNTKENYVRSVAFNPWGDRIIASGYRTVVVWDAFDYTEVHRLRGNQTDVYSVAFAPDGLSILTASSGVKIWDSYNGTERFNLSAHRGEVTAATFSPDGNYILTGSWDTTVKLWSANLLIETLKLKQNVGSNLDANYSPDGRLIVAADEWGNIVLYDSETGEVVNGWTEADDVLVNSATFSPVDNQRIVTADSNGNIMVWEIGKDGPVLVTGDGDASDGAASAVFSPDGNSILSADYNGIATIWDANSGAQIMTLDGNDGNRVFDAQFSDDGNYIVTASEDNTARIWDAKTGEILTTLTGHTDYVLTAAFSHDGKFVYTAGYDNTIRKWDAHTGDLLLTITGHTGRVLDLEVSPDDTLLVSGSADTTVKVWNTQSGKEIFNYLGNNEEANSVAFNHDGTRVLTAGSDETTKEFMIDYDDLLRTAQLYELRPLLPEECQRFLHQDNCALTLFGDKASTAETQPTPAVVEQPTEAVVESTPTPIPEPTQTPKTSNDEGQSSYKLDLDTVLDTWDVFMPTGVESQVSAGADGGSLSVQLSQYEEKLPRFYLVNREFDYSNVRVELSTTNYGNNSNGVILLCQVSDAGWYEFQISNAGLYTINAYDPSSTLDQGFIQLTNGGAPAIHAGKSQNVYAAECHGNELYLYANDTLITTYTDTSYGFTSGYVGFGIASPDLLPVDVSIDSVTVTEQ